MKLHTKSIIIICLSIFLAASFAFSFNSEIVHPALTDAAIRTYDKTAGTKLTEKQKGWIITGSIQEDTDPRYLNHFYNPESGKGLKFLGVEQTPASRWLMLQLSATGDYSVLGALRAYKHGNKKRAYQAVGHILHLFQDMATPAHVRLDIHPPSDPDPFEIWTRDNVSRVKTGQIKKINNIESAFKSLATFTNNNFFSKDTIGLKQIKKYEKKDVKNNINKVNTYLISKINGVEYKVAYIENADLFRSFYTIDNEAVHRDYWNILAPKAVDYSAGVIDYMQSEFEKIDKEKAKLGWFKKTTSYVNNSFLNVNDNFTYYLGDTYNISKNTAKLGWKGIKWGTDKTVQGSKYVYGKTKTAAIKTADYTVKKAEIAKNATVKGAKYTAGKAVEAKDATVRGAKRVGDAGGRVLSAVEDSAKNKINDIKVLGQGIKNLTKDKEEAEEQVEPKPEIELSRVIDGDTFILKTGERVRLIGVDTPELNKKGIEDDECMAWQAKMALGMWLQKGGIKLEKDPGMDKDKYGRILRYVYTEEHFVNVDLAKRGLAEVFYCQPGWKNCPLAKDMEIKRKILEANKSAQENKMGIYSIQCQSERNLKEKEEKIEKDKEKTAVKPAPVFFFSSGPPSQPKTDKDEQTGGEAEIKIEASSTPPKLKEYYLYDKKSFSHEFSASTSLGVYAEFEDETIIDGYHLSASSSVEVKEGDWQKTLPIGYKSEGGGLKKVFLFVKFGEESGYFEAGIFVDTTPPKVLITSPGSGAFVNSTSTKLSFSADEQADYRYKIENDEWSASASSSEQIIRLPGEGEIVLFVEATDRAGNIGVASSSFVVDITAPTSSVVGLPLESTRYFKVSWDGSGSLFDVQYQKNEEAWMDWKRNTRGKEAQFTQSVEYGDVVGFRSRAIDEAGNIEEWGDGADASTTIKNYKVLISEIQIGQTGPTDEFVTLYNPNGIQIHMNGFRLSKKSELGEEFDLLNNFPKIFIEPHSYILISHPLGYKGNSMADLTYLSHESLEDKNTVILYNDAGNYIDKVGLAGASDYEGSGGANFRHKFGSVLRKATYKSKWDSMKNSWQDEFKGNSYDTDNNVMDFVAEQISEKHNSATAPEPRVERAQNPYRITSFRLDPASIDTGSVRFDWEQLYWAKNKDDAFFDIRYEEEDGACKINIDWNKDWIERATTSVPSAEYLSSNSYEVAGLKPATSYCFGLATYNGEYWSELSNQIKVKTKDASLSGPTFATGTIASSGVWTKKASPYIVDGSLIVEEGASLYLEPGVEVLFGAGSNLIADGDVIAEGVSDENVVFTSMNDAEGLQPSPGDWDGIEVGKTGKIDFNYVQVKYGSNKMINISSLYSWFTGQKYYKRSVIRNSVIASSSGVAIFDQGAGTKILNSIIKNNPLAALEISQESSSAYEYNNFQNNSKAILFSKAKRKVQIHFNNFLGNDIAFWQTDGYGNISAENNYWGDEAGPILCERYKCRQEDMASSSGERVYLKWKGTSAFIPWSKEPIE